MKFQLIQIKEKMMKRIAIGIVCLCFCHISSAQIEDVTPGSRSAEQTIKQYRYTSESEVTDTFKVMVINPFGEMQTLPVKEKSLTPAGQVEFDFDTQYWRDGMYTIVVEGARGLLRSKRIRIQRNGQPKKR